MQKSASCQRSLAQLDHSPDDRWNSVLVFYVDEILVHDGAKLSPISWLHTRECLRKNLIHYGRDVPQVFDSEIAGQSWDEAIFRIIGSYDKRHVVERNDGSLHAGRDVGMNEIISRVDQAMKIAECLRRMVDGFSRETIAVNGSQS